MQLAPSDLPFQLIVCSGNVTQIKKKMAGLNYCAPGTLDLVISVDLLVVSTPFPICDGNCIWRMMWCGFIFPFFRPVYFFFNEVLIMFYICILCAALNLSVHKLSNVPCEFLADLKCGMRVADVELNRVNVAEPNCRDFLI